MVSGSVEYREKCVIKINLKAEKGLPGTYTKKEGGVADDTWLQPQWVYLQLHVCFIM